MGKVWVAEHLTLETQVVVKLMAKEVADDADAVARFSREASAAAAVKSPHVVQMLDYGVTSDREPYIVMELLEGRDLSTHLDGHGPMSPRDVAVLVSQVAKALGKAHQVGVIHRDIKPENIFLCDGDAGELFVKLLDFGIAKRQQQVGTSTTTGTVVGTPFYMSPEQLVGDREADARSDIWSLGVVAFEALTGRRPFDGNTVGAITLSIHSTSPRLTAFVPDLPQALDAWFARACARRPEERFATAREAAQALSVAVGESPGSEAVIRAALPSLPTEGPSSEGSFAADRLPAGSSTHLSSTAPASLTSRRPPAALLAGAGAAVVVLLVIVVVALGKSSSPAASVSAPDEGASLQPVAPSALSAAAPASVTVADPEPAVAPTIAHPASPPASASAKAAAPSGARGGGGASHPVATGHAHPPARPARPPRRRDDDDIK